MGILLLIVGAFILMGGIQTLAVFAALGLMVTVFASLSMAVGKVFFRL
ncbi:MAG: hypothetical protein HY646_18155 [Acidobacteria bacterium]|nr:hypothetical protein [Acidobacteriota bacterium]